jgi:benzoyl-CoA reductase/2-hydroxyglutaryl-CoA dehydratase subunit BcrC/BadD/HgdB
MDDTAAQPGERLHGGFLRPDIMIRFDRLSETFLLDIETLKEDGTKVVGLYCTFAPTELVRAAGAVPVGLCGKKQAPIPAAEKILPTRLCPLIKSSYGYALTDTCPYFEASDFLIGETTCDGKKKMFELMQRLKPLHLMNLPYSYSDGDHDYWRDQVMILKGFLENQTGKTIEEAELREQIRVQNEVRKLLQEVTGLFAHPNVPLSGMDMMGIMESKSFVVRLEDYADLLRELKRELMTRIDNGISVCKPNAPRILLTGCPVGKGSEKVIRLIEECGGVVVCQENCTGLKSFDLLVEEDGDPYTALARRYLLTPCSCMTPNTGRLDLLRRLVEQFNVQGVLDLTWFCCHTYNVETYSVRELISQELGLPYIHMETDYSESDLPQLRVRIEAFLEMIDGRLLT